VNVNKHYATALRATATAVMSVAAGLSAVHPSWGWLPWISAISGTLGIHLIPSVTQTALNLTPAISDAVNRIEKVLKTRSGISQQEVITTIGEMIKMSEPTGTQLMGLTPVQQPAEAPEPAHALVATPASLGQSAPPAETAVAEEVQAALALIPGTTVTHFVAGVVEELVKRGIIQ
jgi:hypothetical protein